MVFMLLLLSYYFIVCVSVSIDMTEDLIQLRVDNVFSKHVQTCIESSKHDHGDCLFQFLIEHYEGFVMEVGSFDGLQAIEASILGHDVISFEPDVEHYKVVESNIEKNKSNLKGKIYLQKYAASNKEGNFTFITSGNI